MIEISAGDVALRGDLILPDRARGLVVFVHGSGSSRFSSRNRFVARTLNENRFATLLADLLTPEEEALDEQTSELRFNVDLLAHRTARMIQWSRDDSPVNALPLGLFGASTGAAAAIIAAAQLGDAVNAVVSRGGRIDLAGSSLKTLRPPLLTIVGALDLPIVHLHRSVMPQLTCVHEYEAVRDAMHLFEEPGALERVAKLASGWFSKYLRS